MASQPAVLSIATPRSRSRSRTAADIVSRSIGKDAQGNAPVFGCDPQHVREVRPVRHCACGGSAAVWQAKAPAPPRLCEPFVRVCGIGRQVG
jgi:hypothetical protein